MPPKKSPPDGKKSSSSKKGSPKKRESPSKKGSPNSKKGQSPENEQPFWPPPRVETPPLVAPRGPGVMYVKREPWYPYINNPDFVYREYSWNPFCPLITSWGHLWVSDPQNRKIWRYIMEPCLDDMKKLPDIITKGEPYQIIETPNSGRILALIRCPKSRKSTLTQFSPDGEVENVRDYLFEDPPNASKTLVDPNKPPFYLDEGRPLGVAVDSDIIVILRNPIQRMELLSARKLQPVEFILQGWCKTEGLCVHLATSGGCAIGNGLLYVAATRPGRIFVFKVVKEMCYRIVDRIIVTAFLEFGMDRLKQPYCLRLDSLNVLAVSDRQWDFLRAYQRGGVETSSFGGWKVDNLRVIRPGHFSVSKNGIICLVDQHKNNIVFYIDRIMFKWYRDTLFYMEKLAWLRPVVDDELPPKPPVRRPEPKGSSRGFVFINWPPDDPDGIWPRPPKNAIPEEEKEVKISPGKKSKKSKDSPQSKGKSKSSPKKGKK